jgi:antibiotic biosynthesis monooxygenase (ABM) superfamily enzyme
MVLYVGKWNVRPEKAREYEEWAKSAIGRMFTVPGIVEFRGYRAATGSREVVVTFEFADLNAWATWQNNEDMMKLRQETNLYCDNINYELWGPSPVVPEPVRPGK